MAILINTKWVRALLLSAGTLCLFSGEARAQLAFAGEGRASVTLPQGDLSDAGAEAGLGLGGELQVTFRTNLTAYVGLQRYGFGCSGTCLSALGDNPRSSGVAAGLKYIFHNPGDVMVWGRGGVVANTLSRDGGSSDREIGFEVGVGADLPVAPRIFLVPNAGFVNHDAGNGFGVSFFTLGVGLHYHIN